MNCGTCNYIKRENKKHLCTRKIFEDGIVSPILPERLHLDCPVHSSNNLIEETRYDMPDFYRINSDDVCPICGRMIKDKKNFKEYKIEDGETGEVVKKNICLICFDNLGKTEGDDVSDGTR
jgi:hypothetical protein